MIDGVPETDDLDLEEARKLESEADDVLFVLNGEILLEQRKGDKVLLRDRMPQEVFEGYCQPALEKMLDDLTKAAEGEGDKDDEEVGA